MRIAISQLLWRVGDFRARIFCKSLWGNSGKYVGVRVVVEINFIVNFGVFLGGFGVKGNVEILIAISQ